MSPMHKSITALAASALLATVGFATAQSTDATSSTSPNSSMTTTTDANGNPAASSDANAPVNGNQTTTTDANGNQTTTTTTVDTATQVIPAPPTGVVELARPKGTVMPTDKQPDGPLGMQNTVMTTGVVDGITRPSIGDHATPPIPGPDTTIAVTRETTTTTTVTPPAQEAAPAAAPVAEPAAAPAPEAAPEPMPAPRADRN